MNLTSTLDSISQRLEERRAGKWSEYRKLVALVCDGKEPNADRIASVLSDNERTLDELRHDVQLLAKRRKLRIDMDAAPPLESERLKVEQLIVDGEKQLEAIIETHRQKMSPLYARRFDLNQIRKIAQQAQDDLRSSCEDREMLARFEAVNEELTELTNEQGKIQADIKQMKIWMESDRHESKITAFASEAMRFTERADDYEAKIAGLQEKLPALNARIDELSRQLNQIELELLEP